MWLRFLSLGLVLQMLAACGEPTPPPVSKAAADRGKGRAKDAGLAPPLGPNAVTYHADIRPIIEGNCLGCHVEGGIGPMRLDDLENVTKVRELVVIAVANRVMPPWPASSDCRELRDVRTLPDDQVALFSQWRDAGFPDGNEADYLPKEMAVRPTLSDPTLVLMPPDGYLPDPAAITNEYRCFLTEGTFDEDTYLTAMDIRPGVRGEVHHVQVHKIKVSQLAAVRALDDAAAGAGYPCGGGAGQGISSVNMFSWRPGSAAIAFDDGDAALVEAGSAFVLQVHYNNQFAPMGQTPTPDRSGVAFWTLPKGEIPARIVVRTGVFGPVGPAVGGTTMGVIPAGQAGVVGERQVRMSQLSTVNAKYVPGEIIGMTPHMHTLGSRLSAMLTRPDGTTQCMIDVPKWNFEWQLDYSYAKTETYAAEDMLSVRCEYDNTAEHQPVLNGQRIQPRDVTWGEGSLDEMCLNYVWFRYDRAAFLTARGLQP